MKNRGVALIISFAAILLLTILGAAMVSRSISEQGFAQRHEDSLRAFWLAEAGVNRALKELRANYGWCLGTTSSKVFFGQGAYEVAVDPNPDGSRTITSYGFFPSAAPFRAKLEVVMDKYIPANFYDDAIYSAGNIVLKGSSYDVVGSARFAGDIIGDTSKITVPPVKDPSISPLAHLDYSQLRAISQSQGNYHDSDNLGGTFPSSFWFSPGVPNVVFIEGSLTLKGNDSVGGFFVVGGEVTYDATISGTVSVDGCLYTRGNFTIKGGGNALNVDGGVWAGGAANLDGNAKITYNPDYMSAIKALNINASVQIKSWKDRQNPFVITP